jgi:hypothetical protein
VTDSTSRQASTPIRRTGGFISADEAAERMHRFQREAFELPDTFARARAAYVRGDIELDEFERRVEALIAAGRSIDLPTPPPSMTAPQRFVRDIRIQWERMGVPRRWHPALVTVGGLSMVAGLVDTFV